MKESNKTITRRQLTKNLQEKRIQRLRDKAIDNKAKRLTGIIFAEHAAYYQLCHDLEFKNQSFKPEVWEDRNNVEGGNAYNVFFQGEIEDDGNGGVTLSILEWFTDEITMQTPRSIAIQNSWEESMLADIDYNRKNAEDIENTEWRMIHEYFLGLNLAS